MTTSSTASRRSTTTRRTPPEHHWAATEVPRNSGHPRRGHHHGSEGHVGQVPQVGLEAVCDEGCVTDSERTVLVLHPASARGLEFDGVVVVEPADFPPNVGDSGCFSQALLAPYRNSSFSTQNLCQRISVLVPDSEARRSSPLALRWSASLEAKKVIHKSSMPTRWVPQCPPSRRSSLPSASTPRAGTRPTSPDRPQPRR